MKFKKIDNLPYYISNNGIVKNHLGDIMKPHNKDGYKRISLFNGTKYVKRYIHRLVAAAFIPNPENLPEIDHIDGDRANNHATNLRWCTRKQNANNPITRKRMSERIITNEVIEKRRLKLMGHIVSIETRIKISNSKKGKPNGRLGKKHSEETKVKISNSKRK